jgi:hypothetical protein
LKAPRGDQPVYRAGPREKSGDGQSVICLSANKRSYDSYHARDDDEDRQRQDRVVKGSLSRQKIISHALFPSPGREAPGVTH